MRTATLQRLREGSTWAGISALAMLFGASVESAQAIAQVGAAVAAVVAVVLPDPAAKPTSQPAEPQQ